jgi:hypothetical protein
MHATKHRRRPPRKPRKRHDERSRRPVDRIIGIDGEGIGRAPHRYTYLAAVDEQGKSWEVAAGKAPKLSTVQCLDLILSLPARALIVGFSWVYDLTKMLEDLPDKALYLLFHEQLRARIVDGNVVYRPIKWNGYKLNYMNRRFTVSATNISNSSRTVWDVFRFFQSSFINSLITWNIADKTKLEAMATMKDSRSRFDQLTTEAIHGYCKEECAYLAKLTRELIDAHEAADLTLKTYYGAGSTASVFLKRHGIGEQRGEIPEQMRKPVACAFFGGRFENSYVGAFSQRVYDYDISSAYPYQTFRLPCLLCGHWTLHRQPRGTDLPGVLQLVHWRSRRVVTTASWGPLPIRTREGTIVFPLAGKGGWCWGEEFKAALQLNPHLEATEAWTYEVDCEHRPFASVPDYYRERVKLGKDSRGIVLKLGINSLYGKLAQSKGFNPPFQSWVWAGVITSNTRAQLLQAIVAAKQQRSILMLATDGVWSTERLDLPRPVDTGTFDLAKPLGGWEEKIFDKGVFAVRPGIYFPISPTEDEILQVRARGLGRKALYQRWQQVVDAYNEGKPKISIGDMTRFVGAKSGIIQGSQGVTRRSCYGEWIEHRVDVSFAPGPKREAINVDGTLKPWVYLDFESVPYNPATMSPEAMMLKLAEQIAEEQPDGDFDSFMVEHP